VQSKRWSRAFLPVLLLVFVSSASCAGTGAVASRGGVQGGRVQGDGVTGAVVEPSSECSRSVATGDVGSLNTIMNNAAPGDVICVGAGDLGPEPIAIVTSGTEGAPIRIRAQGTVVTAGVDITANWVTLDGFTVYGHPGNERPGIRVKGVGVELVGNAVADSEAYGIQCMNEAPFCDRARIVNNQVERSVGTGIFVYGTDIEVAANDVSASRQVDDSDADGIRFFGERIFLHNNDIHDISAAGWPENVAPHTDCFQTFTQSKRPVIDVRIEANTCDRVDDQCLIAEGTGTSHGIVFINNICRVRGSQAIYLRNVQGTVVANNLFMAGIKFTGVYVDEGSSHTVILNNAFIGDIDPYVVRNSPNATTDYNLASLPGGGVRPGFKEVHGRSGRPPHYLKQLTRLRTEVKVARNDPVVDAGRSVGVAPRDLFGRVRPTDGNGDGVAKFDIGPFEAARPVGSASAAPSGGSVSPAEV
jgi:hypothetical protein